MPSALLVLAVALLAAGHSSAAKTGYAVWPALTSESEAAPVTVYLDGGPGVSSVEALLRRGEFRKMLQAAGPLVAIDQAYSETSQPSAHCTELMSLRLNRVPNPLEVMQLQGSILARCAAQARTQGIEPDDLHAERFARDTLGLLDTLGIDRIRIVAFSYGTQIAQLILALAPHRVIDALLVGPFPVQAMRREPADIQRVFDRTILSLLETVRQRAIRSELVVQSGEARIAVDEAALLGWALNEAGDSRRVRTLKDALTRLQSPSEPIAEAFPALGRLAQQVIDQRAGPIHRRAALQHYAAVCAAWPLSTPPNDPLGWPALQHRFVPAICPPRLNPPPNWGALLTPWERDLGVAMIVVTGGLDVRTPASNARWFTEGQSRARVAHCEELGHSELLDQVHWLAQLRTKLRLSIRPPREDQRNDHCP
jgi:pimeloyl-ACP methyl ester carboxylesterase